MPHDDQTELFYWVDENDQELGSILRAEAHDGSMKLHRSIGILVFDDQPEQSVLFQQRSNQKDMNPGMWSYSVGGHVTYGNDYLETALREAEEELGIKLSNVTLLKKMLIDDGNEREIKSIYKAAIPHDTKINHDPIEIDQTKWVLVSDLPEFTKSADCSFWAKTILEATGYLPKKESNS